MPTWKQGWYVVLGTVVTTSMVVWLGVPHAPAGATTMIVGLGFIRTPPQLGIMLLAVVAVIACGVVINRIAGINELRTS